jgi:hypothetical protein
MHSSNSLVLIVSAVILLGGCASAPTNPDNICEIFGQKRSWYHATQAAEKRWGGPIHVPMAMMYQESLFRPDAKPPMRWLLGFIPLGRASTAYGFSQAKTGTWADYQREAGASSARRDDFADAIDFMYWYIDKSHRINGISKWDARNQYLNYHEGHGGYARGTHQSKTWLIGVAAKVDRRSKTYASQYSSCKKKLERSWLMRLLF